MATSGPKLRAGFIEAPSNGPSAIAMTEASCSPSTYGKSEGKLARNVSSVEPRLLSV